MILQFLFENLLIPFCVSLAGFIGISIIPFFCKNLILKFWKDIHKFKKYNFKEGYPTRSYPNDDFDYIIRDMKKEESIDAFEQWFLIKVKDGENKPPESIEHPIYKIFGEYCGQRYWKDATADNELTVKYRFIFKKIDENKPLFITNPNYKIKEK